MDATHGHNWSWFGYLIRQGELLNEHRSSAAGSRGMRLADAPKQSVVVASRGDRPALDACLAALLPTCRRHDVEMVVARSFAAGEYEALTQRYPSVLFMPGPDGATIRQLRVAGFTAADGDIVHLLQDDSALDDAWLETLTPRLTALDDGPAMPAPETPS